MPRIALIVAVVYASVFNQQPPTFTLQTYIPKIRDTTSNIGVTLILLKMAIGFTSCTLSINGIVETVTYKFSSCDGYQRLQDDCEGTGIYLYDAKHDASACSKIYDSIYFQRSSNLEGNGLPG